MSHVVITCTCPERCEVPGHGSVPLLIDPNDLAAAGDEAFHHLDDAMQSILKARASWVSRGLPGDNPFPRSLDQLAMVVDAKNKELRRWTSGAKVVAERRSTADA